MIALVHVVGELTAGADPYRLADERALVGEGVGILLLQEDVVVGIDLDIGIGIGPGGLHLVIRPVDEADTHADERHHHCRYSESDLWSLLHEISPS